MRSLGYSNKSFYYQYNGQDLTFEIRYQCTFNEKVDEDILKKALIKTLSLYPEYQFKPVINQGDICAKENSFSFVIVDGLDLRGDGTRRFGSEDTNGYMFFFGISENKFLFFANHAMADHNGLFTFFKTAIVEYLAQKNGFVVDETTLEAMMVRKSAPFENNTDSEALKYLDPYLYYVPKSRNEDAYKITLMQSAAIREQRFSKAKAENMVYLFEVDNDSFYKKTKELGVSYAHLLTLIYAKAIKSAYGKDGEPVTIMFPVDMRRFFDTDTRVNFSDGIVINYLEEYEQLSITDRCIKIKQQMQEQLNKSNFENKLLDKIDSVKKNELAEGGIEALIKVKEANIQVQEDPNKPKFLSGTMTYPGRLDLPEAFDEFVESIDMYPIMGNVAVSVYSYKNKLCIQMLQPYSTDKVAKAMKEAIEEIGIAVKLTDERLVSKNILDLGAIERV